MDKTRIILPCITTFFLATSCSKDDTPVRPATTGTDILMAKNWQITSDIRTLTAAGSTVSTPPDEIYTRYSPCLKDDFWQFAAGSQFVQDAGALKCSTADLQSIAGTWNLSADERELQVNLRNLLTTYEVLVLTPNNLKIKYIWITPEDIKVETIYTLQAL